MLGMQGFLNNVQYVGEPELQRLQEFLGTSKRFAYVSNIVLPDGKLCNCHETLEEYIKVVNRYRCEYLFSGITVDLSNQSAEYVSMCNFYVDKVDLVTGLIPRGFNPTGVLDVAKQRCKIIALEDEEWLYQGGSIVTEFLKKLVKERLILQVSNTKDIVPFEESNRIDDLLRVYKECGAKWITVGSTSGTAQEFSPVLRYLFDKYELRICNYVGGAGCIH